MHEKLSARTQYDDGGGAVSDFFVLCPAQLNHALGRGMGDLDFAQNGVAVVCEDDATHRVEQHLQHSLGAQT